MYFVIIGMLLTLVLAAVVLALVAVPARRQGREILSAQGEELVSLARERTSEAVEAAKDRVGGLTDRLPRAQRDEPHGHDAGTVNDHGHEGAPGRDETSDRGSTVPDRADPVIDLRASHVSAHLPLQ